MLTKQNITEMFVWLKNYVVQHFSTMCNVPGDLSNLCRKPTFYREEKLAKKICFWSLHYPKIRAEKIDQISKIFMQKCVSGDFVFGPDQPN